MNKESIYKMNAEIEQLIKSNNIDDKVLGFSILNSLNNSIKEIETYCESFSYSLSFVYTNNRTQLIRFNTFDIIVSDNRALFCKKKLKEVIEIEEGNIRDLRTIKKKVWNYQKK